MSNEIDQLIQENRRLVDENRELSGRVILAEERVKSLQRALHIRPATHPITTDSVQIGPLSIYNPEPEQHYGLEYVRCYLGSDVVLPHEGGIVENAGQSVLLDRRTWDALVAALGVKEAA